MTALASIDPSNAWGIVAEATRRFKPTRWCPIEPTKKQKALLSLIAKEVLYGGQAGGGKTVAMAMAALQYVDHPDYSALLLRRTFKELDGAGGLLSILHEWLAGTAARWNEKDKRYTFPSGAIVQAGYMATERDKYQYQGKNFHLIGFDELTHFLPSQYTYMFSRARRKKGSVIPIRIWSTANPGGVGHDFVKSRFIDNPNERRVFLPASLKDNPHVDHEDYIESLGELSETERRQLMLGEWIKDSQSLVYAFDPMTHLVDEAPHYERAVLGVDLGTSETKPTTAYSLFGFAANDDVCYMLEADKTAGDTPSSIAERLRDYKSRYPIERIVIDAGGLGGGYIKEFQSRHRIPCEAAQKRDKLGHRKLMNGAFRLGKLKIVEPTCGPYIEEVQQLIWNEHGTDNEKGQDNHCTDAGLYGWWKTKSYQADMTPKPPPIVYGTEEWARQEEERIERLLTTQQDNNAPWWVAS